VLLPLLQHLRGLVSLSLFVGRPIDWTSWNLFIQNDSMNNKLTTPLGTLILCPHQHWTWFYNEDNDMMYNLSPNTTYTYYSHLQNPYKTRWGTMLFGNSSAGLKPSLEGIPITVQEIFP
jgi:hypothetical protein